MENNNNLEKDLSNIEKCTHNRFMKFNVQTRIFAHFQINLQNMSWSAKCHTYNWNWITVKISAICWNKFALYPLYNSHVRWLAELSDLILKVDTLTLVEIYMIHWYFKTFHAVKTYRRRMQNDGNDSLGLTIWYFQ